MGCPRTVCPNQTWPALHVVRVKEQCCFNSTSDPFNGQTANFILIRPKVIESRTLMLKKANLECYWNNTMATCVKSFLSKIFFCFPELPDEGPVITGGLPNYQLNDQLTLNCTSPRTFPPTLLKWKINKKAVKIYFFYQIIFSLMTCQII